MEWTGNNITGEPTTSGREKVCPCGLLLSPVASDNILGGEINHYRFACPQGHRWEHRQIGWTSYAWVYLGGVQELVNVDERIALTDAGIEAAS